MKIEEIREVIIRDTEGQEIKVGDKVLFRDKTNRDFIAEFRGYEKGLMQLENISDTTEYNIRVSSVVYAKIMKNNMIEGVGEIE